MTDRRFLTSAAGDDPLLFIEDEEHHHLVRVMRARAGMEIEAVNGRGDWFRARLTRITASRAEAEVIERQRRERPPLNLIMAPSILKKRPMDLMLEKLCELGVDEIRPVCFTRSDGDCPATVPARWLRVASQAIKVNRRLWTTRIAPPLSLEQLLHKEPLPPARVSLEIRAERNLPREGAPPLVCLVGPPGDYTAEERRALEGAGFRPWCLNPGVLRSETAAIAAAAVLQHLLAPQS